MIRGEAPLASAGCNEVVALRTESERLQMLRSVSWDPAALGGWRHSELAPAVHSKRPGNG
jgi:hypothetical protein